MIFFKQLDNDQECMKTISEEMREIVSANLKNVYKMEKSVEYQKSGLMPSFSQLLDRQKGKRIFFQKLQFLPNSISLKELSLYLNQSLDECVSELNVLAHQNVVKDISAFQEGITDAYRYLTNFVKEHPVLN